MSSDALGVYNDVFFVEFQIPNQNIQFNISVPENSTAVLENVILKQNVPIYLQ